MAISLHDASVLAFIQVLGAVEGILTRGADHCAAEGIDPEAIVATRLIPDMQPFSFQVLSCVRHSVQAIEGVRTGVFSPDPYPPHSYSELQSAISAGRTALEQMNPDDINALEGKDVLFQVGDFRMPFTAEGFLMSFSLPNLHFHATTVYDILRMKGAPLGKRDYMGRMRMKA